MTSNTSLYAIPVAWVVAILPRGYAVATFNRYSRSNKGPDLINPRLFSAQAGSDTSIPPAIREKIKRAESAQLNGFENIGFYAAAVVAGNAAGVDIATLNGIAWAYVGSRLLYNYIFINNDRISPFLRTAVFMTGIGMNCVLFVLAGLHWQNRV